MVNVLRMQGAWDWYVFDSWTHLPMYIPYSLNYFFNPIFIVFSFLIPALAFLAFVLKQKKFNLLATAFLIMLVIGVFLTSGTHPPTGGLFAFFVVHVPFFSLFRSPWYIFAPLIGLSIAGLVGIFFENLYERVPRRVTNIFGVIFIIGVLFYSYPLLLGKIFRPASQNGFFIKFPSYVYETRDYLAKTKVDGRILSYPDDNIEKFSWGYSGTDSILNLFSDKEVIFTPLNDTESPLSKIVSNLYLSLKKNELTKVENLARVLSLTQIFDKRDQESLSPALPKRILENKIANFGKWSFYGLPNSLENSKKIVTYNCCVLSYPYFESSLNLTVMTPRTLLVNPNDSLFTYTKKLDETGAIVHATNSQFSEYLSMAANSSDLKPRLFTRDPGVVSFSMEISKNGDYFPILEKNSVDLFGIVNQNKVNLTVDGLGGVWTINNSDDSYLYFEPVFLSKGQHVVSINLKNKNLINQNVFAQHGVGNFNFSNGVFSISNLSDKNISFEFPVVEFDPYGHYLINISYNQIYGNNAQVYIDQKNKTTPFKNQIQILPNYPDWQDYNFYYNPIQSDSNLVIGLVSPQPKDPLGTKVQYRNLGVYRVFDNNLFFKMEPKEKPKLANITYTMDSPVSYTGKLSGGNGPQVIVFNENYSPNWQLSISGNLQAKIFHFTGNSYANAWYIESAPSEFDFTITYKPQSLLKMGYFIAALSIIIGIMYFLYDLRRRRNGK